MFFNDLGGNEAGGTPVSARQFPPLPGKTCRVGKPAEASRNSRFADRSGLARMTPEIGTPKNRDRMKVSGVGSGASVGGAKRTEKSDGKKGAFKTALAEAMDTMEEVHAVETASGINAVDALLVVQSVGDAGEESRRRMMQRGDDILDRLEEIRHGLLIGVVPKEKLVELSQLVRTKRENCHDPRLASLLDEIELRAEVEIAKLSRGL